MIILAPRGIEKSRPNYWPESSYESFKNQIDKGFGLEIDLNFTKNKIIIWHDKTLNRLTKGEDKRSFKDVFFEEISSLRYGKNKKGRIASFEDVLDLIRKSKSQVHALHLKSIDQSNAKIDEILKKIQNNKKLIKKLLIFNLKPKIAKYIKLKNKNIKLAPSVAHPYDILRYNKAVGGSLISVNEAINYKKQKLYEWVWLDEWDLVDKFGEKKFYTEEIFKKLRKVKYKIALVTPELHATSPELYGGEFHPDAKNKKRLFKRIKQILSLKPDAVCTDFPEEVLKLTKQ